MYSPKKGMIKEVHSSTSQNLKKYPNIPQQDNGQIVMSSYYGIPYRNENKQATATCYNTDKSHMFHKNKADSNKYMKFKSRKKFYCRISQDRDDFAAKQCLGKDMVVRGGMVNARVMLTILLLDPWSLDMVLPLCHFIWNSVVCTFFFVHLYLNKKF